MVRHLQINDRHCDNMLTIGAKAPSLIVLARLVPGGKVLVHLATNDGQGSSVGSLEIDPATGLVEVVTAAPYIRS